MNDLLDSPPVATVFGTPVNGAHPQPAEPVQMIDVERHLDDMAQGSRSARSKVPRFEVSPIARKDEYEAWTHQLRGVCAMLGITAVVDMAQTTNASGKRACGDMVRVTAQQAAAYAAVGAHVQAKLQGETLQLC